jgi:hypothetical protein
MADKKATKGGSRKIGRNTEKCKRYRALHTREKRALKNVLRSSMLAEAKRYAEKHGLTGYLNSISPQS